MNELAQASVAMGDDKPIAPEWGRCQTTEWGLPQPLLGMFVVVRRPHPFLPHWHSESHPPDFAPGLYSQIPHSDCRKNQRMDQIGLFVNPVTSYPWYVFVLIQVSMPFIFSHRDL